MKCVSGSMVPVGKREEAITFSHQGQKRLFCVMAVEVCYWWLVQSKRMTWRQLQGFCCCCSVSWFQSQVHASYFGHRKYSWMCMVFMWQKCLFSEVGEHLLCFSTGGLPNLPSNSKCQIKTPWGRLHWFCWCFGDVGFLWFPLSPYKLFGEKSLIFLECICMNCQKITVVSGYWELSDTGLCCVWSVNLKDTTSLTSSGHFNTLIISAKFIENKISSVKWIRDNLLLQEYVWGIRTL